MSVRSTLVMKSFLSNKIRSQDLLLAHVQEQLLPQVLHPPSLLKTLLYPTLVPNGKGRPRDQLSKSPCGVLRLNVLGQRSLF